LLPLRSRALQPGAIAIKKRVGSCKVTDRHQVGDEAEIAPGLLGHGLYFYCTRFRSTMAWIPLLPSTNCVTRRSQARLQNT
jgi:hypothetical protein